MNGKTILAALLAAPMALSAAEWRIDAGYGTVNLGAYKDEMAKTASDFKGLGHDITSNTLPGGDLYATTGIDFILDEKFTVGVEGGIAFLGKHILKTKDPNPSPSIGSITRYEVERDFSLIPVGLRLGYLSTKGQGLYYGLSLGLGLGFGTMSGSVSYSTAAAGNTVVDTSYSTSFRGQGFVGDLSARAGYEWPSFRVGAGLGYRQASFSEFTSTATVANPSGGNPIIREGDALKNSKGDALVMDMGGIKANAEFAFKF